MTVKLHKNAEYIIKTLNDAGFEAYAVGGCVRDSIMGRPCDDTDITTNALPNQTKAVFSSLPVLETGIKHGTVTVLIENAPFEITTYRKDSQYSDSRHPDSVTYVRELKDDLARRDFTVNAIAYSHITGLQDLFFGVEDINNKLIRAVGDPYQRFSEDALRILRALRFASVLGFKIEENTSNALKELAETLNKVSPERIYTELKKLLCGKNAQYVIDNYISVINKIISVNGNYKIISRLPCDFAMRLACLCGDAVGETLIRLRADNKTKHICNILVNSSPVPENETELKLYISSLGREDALAVSAYRRAVFGEDIDRKTERLLDSNTPLFISDLAVNGSDLHSLGINGSHIGETLNNLLIAVIKNELPNTKETLLKSVIK